MRFRAFLGFWGGSNPRHCTHWASTVQDDDSDLESLPLISCKSRDPAVLCPCVYCVILDKCLLTLCLIFLIFKMGVNSQAWSSTAVIVTLGRLSESRVHSPQSTQPGSHLQKTNERVIITLPDGCVVSPGPWWLTHSPDSSSATVSPPGLRSLRSQAFPTRFPRFLSSGNFSAYKASSHRLSLTTAHRLKN